MCQKQGRVTAASVVDHIIPHKGDQKLFWDSANNWQSLCKDHHDAAKQAEERHGYSSEVGLDGWPIDQKHPANRPV
jgi:5-methylcytosine-specific restriction endonuclease McrA